MGKKEDVEYACIHGARLLFGGKGAVREEHG